MLSQSSFMLSNLTFKYTPDHHQHRSRQFPLGEASGQVRDRAGNHGLIGPCGTRDRERRRLRIEALSDGALGQGASVLAGM